MSALPAYSPPIVTPAPAPVRPAPRVRRRSRRRPRILGRIVAFGGMALATFAVNGVLGNALLERARQDTLEATRRTRAAQSMETSLQRQVLALTEPDATLEWVAANGFVASDLPVDASPKVSRVATRR